MRRPGTAFKIRSARKLKLDNEKAQANVVKKRKERESLDEMRIVRSADGWRIEHNKAGYRRRSVDEWPTRADAEKAIADGYKLPEYERDNTTVKLVPVYRKSTIKSLRSLGHGFECHWCKLNGITQKAHFGVTFRSRDETIWVTRHACDPDNHKLNNCSWFNSDFEIIRSFLYEENNI